MLIGNTSFTDGCHLAVVCSGSFEDAIAEHKQELAICEALDDQLGMAVAHRRVGECYGELGNFDDALWHQRLHLDLAQRCASVLEQQRAHATIGLTHFRRAEACTSGTPQELQALDSAEESFHQSLRTCELLRGTITDGEYSEMKTRLLLNFGLSSCTADYKCNISLTRGVHCIMYVSGLQSYMSS